MVRKFRYGKKLIVWSLLVALLLAMVPANYAKAETSIAEGTEENPEITEEEEKEIKVLMVGNSFTRKTESKVNYNVGEILQRLADINEKKLDVDIIANDGAYLSYYAFWSHDYKAYHEQLLTALKENQYDYIILQDQTKVAVEKYEDTMFPAIRQIYAYVDSYQENAKIWLYETAAYEDGTTVSVNGTEKTLTAQEFQERNLYGYTRIQNELGFEVIPIGSMIYHATQIFPEINMVCEDLRHPSYDGYYLAAASFYYRLYGEKPMSTTELLGYSKVSDENLGKLNTLPGNTLLLNKNKVSIKLGETTTLIPEVRAEEDKKGTIFWKSLNTDIATVDITTGVITGVAEGTTAILAETTTGLMAVCQVEVENDKLADIFFSKKSYSVSVGDQICILPQVRNWTVFECSKWTTNNKPVASISQTGVVTAHKIGKATIKLKDITTSEVLASYDLYVSGKPPRNVTAEVKSRKKNGGSIKISWSAVYGAKLYRVYRYDSSTKVYKLIGTSTTTSYVDKTVKGNKKYYYKVTSGAANILTESEKSNKAEAMILKAATVKVTAAKKKFIRLKWDKNTKATGYIIYRSTKKNSGYKEIKRFSSKAKVSYKDKNVKKRKVYYYKIQTYKNTSKQTYYSKKTTAIKARAGKKKTTSSEGSES